LFTPLTREEVQKIAEQHLARIAETLRESHKTMTVEPEALEALVEEGHSLAYGARFLKRVIEERIKMPMSRRWNEGGHFHFKAEGGHVVLETGGPHLVPALAYGT
jgi:ATP-dependent Clp protease ATP-binding subunit ClpA